MLNSAIITTLSEGLAQFPKSPKHREARRRMGRVIFLAGSLIVVALMIVSLSISNSIDTNVKEEEGTSAPTPVGSELGMDFSEFLSLHTKKLNVKLSNNKDNNQIVNEPKLLTRPPTQAPVSPVLPFTMEFKSHKASEGTHQVNPFIGFQNGNTDLIPVFYNLDTKTSSNLSQTRKIIHEQFQRLQKFHKPIYVNSIGFHIDFNFGDPEVGSLSTPENEVVVIGHFDSASEIVTLKSVWNYCSLPENEDQKVVYLHNHERSPNPKVDGRIRRLGTTSALSTECTNLEQDQCNVCSFRFSPIPYPHAAGNFWLARCDYIRKLEDPENFGRIMNSLHYNGPSKCLGKEQDWADHWIYSHPDAKPCDLFSKKKYSWGYERMPKTDEFMKNILRSKAPRFPMEIYQKDECTGFGESRKTRINEYEQLYGESPSETWWGWDFFK